MDDHAAHRAAIVAEERKAAWEAVRATPIPWRELLGDGQDHGRAEEHRTDALRVAYRDARRQWDAAQASPMWQGDAEVDAAAQAHDEAVREAEAAGLAAVRAQCHAARATAVANAAHWWHAAAIVAWAARQEQE